MKTRTTKQTYFTPDEIKVIQSAALAVWDECAYDCLQATADETGKDINRVTIKRAVVIEIALDAGRAEERIKRRDPALALKLRDCQDNGVTYEQLIDLVKPAFPHSLYGL